MHWMLHQHGYTCQNTKLYMSNSHLFLWHLEWLLEDVWTRYQDSVGEVQVSGWLHHIMECMWRLFAIVRIV